MTGSPALNSGHLDDLTATRLCAEALFGDDALHTETASFQILHDVPLFGRRTLVMGEYVKEFSPLHDDAQAMALVKRFTLSIDAEIADGNGYGVSNSAPGIYYEHTDLNRAIVYCVAKIFSAKQPTPARS